ncbi:MAG TPA: hypothetical protein VFN23_12735 [Ktedonobacteraceae bacterium]|nr:hypothetical protein [Ktedonobacteraceae bacterium]
MLEHQQQRLYTASELADFEYCPLTWWHDQFDPYAQANSDELFAHLVELENQYGQQATAVPEYQMVEQLLLRKGAFEHGQQQHRDYADEVEEAYAERGGLNRSRSVQLILITTIVFVVAAIILISSAFFIR